MMYVTSEFSSSVRGLVHSAVRLTQVSRHNTSIAFPAGSRGWGPIPGMAGYQPKTTTAVPAGLPAWACCLTQCSGPVMACHWYPPNRT